jgi:proton-translocating NADH-quinone oxidoreductase chain L
MYLLIIFLPLCGFLAAVGFGRMIGYRGAALITTTCVSLSALLSIICFYEIGLSGAPCYLVLGDWIGSELFDARWAFLFDSLTAVMLVVVTFVSSLVHLYSIEYMGADPHQARFMGYLSLFTVMMLMLVTADNFLQMFLGWEGVGLASYLLINFWFTRLQANKSAIKAMLMNRVGDFGLALGIFGIFALTGTVEFAPAFAVVPEIVDQTINICGFEFPALQFCCILLFVGAVGKSAQLGLHTWLPDAMEGPTPVSALIHAATMVTAGVFLIARCSILFEHGGQACIIVTCVGAATAFFAATTGVVQNDLKRVIAYSTCSQLGYMVFACGISHYSVGVFHLMNHAFFKALLFLGAGSVIHALSDEQDMRRMGGVAGLLPLTYAMMLCGSLALIGFPFLTGFYSKDVILEVAFAKYSISGNFAYWLGSLSALATSYYSFRLLFLTFVAQTNARKQSLGTLHDAPILMAIPLMILCLGSIFIGYLGKEAIIGMGTPFWQNALFCLPENNLLLESEYIPQSIKMIPLIFSGLGAAIAAYLCLNNPLQAYTLITTDLGRNLYTFLNKRWLVDKVYNDYLGTLSLNFGYSISFKTLDKGVLEIIGPSGAAQFFGSRDSNSFINQIASLQSGKLYHYALIMLLGLTFLIGIVGLWDTAAFWIDSRLVFIQLLAFLFYHGQAREEVSETH